MAYLGNIVILLGKNPQGSDLLISVCVDNKYYTSNSPIFVPDSVSQYKQNEQKAHCQIKIDKSQNMWLINLNPNNQTFVNGLSILKKKICKADTIQLGTDRTSIDINAVLCTANDIVTNFEKKKIAEKSVSKVYYVSHLERVYREYEDAMDRISKQQIFKTRITRIPILISAIVGLSGFFLSASSHIKSIGLIAAVASVLILLYSIFKKDSTVEDKKVATEKLQCEYVCPNPDCAKYLGKLPYNILRQSLTCPYCHCTFIENESSKMHSS